MRILHPGRNLDHPQNLINCSGEHMSGEILMQIRSLPAK